MLARSTLRTAARAPTLAQASAPNARGMATLRELELRLKSVRNIEKITKVRRRVARGGGGLYTHEPCSR
jgi:F-type H+-transporting ATPase subunit gamma